MSKYRFSLSMLFVVFLLTACQEDTPSLDMNQPAALVEAKSSLCTDTENSVATIVSDMEEPHEARPSGVPESYGWAIEPRVAIGNDPGDWQAMITWGQFYEPTGGNPATNIRVQIRDIKAYYLSKTDNQWYLWQESKVVEGAAYTEDFVDDESIPADIRTEDEGVSVAPAGAGYNFHFWTPYRTPIDPDDIAGVFTTVQARLIVDDPNEPDDRSEARIILDIGGDYWATMDAQWDQWKTNGDIGIGRFKFVTNCWQSFNMHTLSPEALRENPPPLD